MEIKDLEVKLSGIETSLKTFLDKHAEEVKANGAASAETKATLEKLGNDWKETSTRLLAVEQAIVARKDGDKGNEVKSVGELIVESENFKAMQKGAGRSGQINVGSFHKTAIVNATGQNQPLVPDMRVPGILTPGLRRLTVRDLMPNLNTQSNLVQFVRELLFTNSAASQTGGSPTSGENVAKAESALTFELDNAPVETIAHWIPASRQILDDAPALAGYINSRLLFGLKIEEERQLLLGSGSSNNLSGLVTEASVYDTTRTTPATDTPIDVLRHAITQAEASFFDVTAIILHPQDWEAIELQKQTGTSAMGEYIFARPQEVAAPRLWSKLVIPTYAMPRSQFLVGAFNMAAAIWDRADATVEVSREHSDFFVKNMVAILCEERLAVTVYRPTALVYGGFPYGS